LISGTVQQEEKGVKVVAQRIFGLAEANEHLTQAIHVKLPLERIQKEHLENLKSILERHKGNCLAYLHLKTESRCEAVIRLGDRLRVKPNKHLIKEVNRYFGDEVVYTVLRNGAANSRDVRNQPRNSRRNKASAAHTVRGN
jgi:DNA polymerase-3 subunit alpha